MEGPIILSAGASGNDGRNAFQGLLLVFLVLSLFLRPSLAGWVAIGLPISFMGAFAAMGLVDASINLVSLFAFIVVLGFLVDDAIVVSESVYTLGSKGEKPLKASIAGTHLVAMPVTFAIITSMVAFVPMLFLWLVGEINERHSTGSHPGTFSL